MAPGLGAAAGLVILSTMKEITHNATDLSFRILNISDSYVLLI